MSKNAFDGEIQVNNPRVRSNHDWSFSNNFSTEFGRITPVFTELVPFDGSLKIDPNYMLKSMPLVFPVQTRMKARLSFFRVPLRTLWEDYRDFIGNFRNDLIEPYHEITSLEQFEDMYRTGKLMDYLGLPTTIAGSYGGVQPLTFDGSASTPENLKAPLPRIDIKNSPLSSYPPSVISWSNGLFGDPLYTSENAINIVTPSITTPAASDDFGAEYFDASISGAAGILNPQQITGERLVYSIPETITLGTTGERSIPYRFQCESHDQAVALHDNLYANGLSYNRNIHFLVASESGNIIVDPDINMSTNHTVQPVESGQTYVTGNIQIPAATDFNDIRYIIVAICNAGSSQQNATTGSDLIAYENDSVTTLLMATGVNVTFSIDIHVQEQARDITFDECPWNKSIGDNSNTAMISAYAARAYESIYNAYYRDNRNNPYILDGQPVYNRFCPTLSGGADTTTYKLRYANYEKDFLTTAVPSPQQGQAPLVGITTYTTRSVASDGRIVEENKLAITDETGSSYGISFESDDEALTGVNYHPLTGQEAGLVKSLIDPVTSGISIADLRNVNAYQKFLEMNMRKGYMYRDIIQGRFNITVRYNELLMPEFVGGSTRDINVSPITQSIGRSDSGLYADALGSQAGMGTVFGDSNTINIYCDEESIVMGLLVVSPCPIYTQLLPKHFLYRELLDHFNPEFNSIGFQPITYKEVCPIQRYAAGASLDDVFGYQRPWYEYVQKYDQAHGDFRLTLRNFLVMREFDEAPELSEAFLTIDPGELDNIFSVTEASDKFYGQIYFNCKAKLPIYRVTIPRLD